MYQGLGASVLENSLKGFNCCLFAYGQTGSGKTYSMFGEDAGADTQGLIPRAVSDVFSRLMDLQRTRETAVVVSFLEIYCDQIRDLGKNPSDFCIELVLMANMPVPGPERMKFCVHGASNTVDGHKEVGDSCHILKGFKASVGHLSMQAKLLLEHCLL